MSEESGNKLKPVAYAFIVTIVLTPMMSVLLQVGILGFLKGLGTVFLSPVLLVFYGVVLLGAFFKGGEDGLLIVGAWSAMILLSIIGVIGGII